jgi:tetratricopeptide (TPR) repeat protein
MKPPVLAALMGGLFFAVLTSAAQAETGQGLKERFGLTPDARPEAVEPEAGAEAGKEAAPSKDALSADEFASREAFLDSLFDRLKEAKNPEQAKIVEAAIWKLWTNSGSASIDYLMDQGLDAMAAGEQGEALIYFTQVTTLAPGYAEGWSKRATLYYLMEDYQRALKDIEQTLRLEPRHFGALGGLALLLNELGDKEGALSAYRKVLKVYPHLPGAQEAVEQLSEEVEGQGI